MGVPAFFRWLSRKYPSVITPCIEEKPVDVNGVRIPVNSADPNPNGVEFDNLYLDMNGIIHPCTHPENKPAPKNEDEMMIAIFECIDRIFSIVRPRKVLYMAIDGVAPRAKMNQQRSRRFRASKESSEKIQEMKNIRDELLLKGVVLPPEKPKEEHFDSNCITPGTPFMARLSDCLHYYIHGRLNNDPGWQGIKVILSDANVPGEGEHKIMDYIRKQRGQPDHDPNTQHCLCGADADLIMLGLATHEPNFTIIREEFKPNQPKPCEICGQLGHQMKDCTGACIVELDSPGVDLSLSSEMEYIFVRLNILKEYLEKELQMPNLPFKYDFERVIDDWVFMCFFVGNDFLPHLPSLEIREGAIDRLVGLYKNCVYRTEGYLTDSGEVNLDRVQLILYELGMAEDEIFKKRQQKEIQFKAREKSKKRRREGFNNCKPNWELVHHTQFAPRAIGQQIPVSNPRQEAYNIRVAGMHSQAEAMLQTTNDKNAPKSMVRPDDTISRKRKMDDDLDNEQAYDEVRLWEDGFKDRYYESKFDVGPNQKEFRHLVALHYVRGLCWVLKYYYQGCASWKWYFPYHYAPFASDFLIISGLSTEFETDTKPFRPLEQLMGVFPAASSKHVPEPWAQLMSDPYSSIIDFYPENFKIDLNGKKCAWQGVALLPFVDEKRLFKALEPYYNKLSPAERKRNLRGDDKLYVSAKNSGYATLTNLYAQQVDGDAEYSVSINGMRGTVLVSENCVQVGGVLNSPVRELAPLENNVVCCVRFRDPKYAKGYIFQAIRLNGAKDPPKVLKSSDFNPQQNGNWRPPIGMAPSSQRVNLDNSGHREINHYTPKPQRAYGNVPLQSYNTSGYRGGRVPHNLRTSDRGRGHNSGGGYNNCRGAWDNSDGDRQGFSSQPRQDYNRERGYYNSGGEHNSGGGYNNSQGGYNNSHGDYNNVHGGYNNSVGGYNNYQEGYNNSQEGYNNSQEGYNNSQGGYNNSQADYNNSQGGYNNSQGGCNNSEGITNSSRGGYNQSYGQRQNYSNNRGRSGYQKNYSSQQGPYGPYRGRYR